MTGADNTNQQCADKSPCILCGHTDSKLLYHGNLGDTSESRFSQYAYFDDIYKCQSCDLVFQRLRHSFEKIAYLIKSETYLDEEIGNLNLFEKHVHFRFLHNLMKDYVVLKDCSILDAGANTGVFLNYIKCETENISGIEPSAEAVDKAQKQFGIKLQQSLISEALLENGVFHVVTMFDVIEHLYNPVSDLNFIFEKLNCGGKIFITTHDIGTILAKISGKHYPMLMYQHFFHFSSATLQRLVEQAGFKVIEIRRFPKSWSFEYLYHLINKLWPGFLGNLLQLAFSPLMGFEMIRKMRITIPVKEFVFLVAEKPLCSQKP